MSNVAYFGYGYLIDGETADKISTFDDSPFFVVYNVHKSSFLFLLDSLKSVEQGEYEKFDSIAGWHTFMTNYENFSMFTDDVVQTLRTLEPHWYLVMH